MKGSSMKSIATWWLKLAFAISLPFITEELLYYGGGLVSEAMPTGIFKLIIVISCLAAIFLTIKVMRQPERLKLLRGFSGCLLVLFLFVWLLANGATSSCGPESVELAHYNAIKPLLAGSSSQADEESCS